MLANGSAMGSFNNTARVMRYIAQNAVHVNGAVRFP
jgi:hypothetical protein